ncbi:MAG: hypothetical protein CMG13_02390 [Candidatus Marinimicrobia bacterium]|nr:hypothetical protein [Candidatus Neomarinimicrobiota bacterium]
MVMYYYLLILFISISFSSSFRGKIVDEYGDALHLVNVEVIATETGASTDMDGYFVIKNISENYFSIKLSHIGYRDRIVTITDSEYDITIVMREEISNINEILIEDERISYVKDAPVMTRIITSQDIKNSPYSSVKDILETAIPNIQNVSSNHAGISNNNVKLQGLDNKYILFLVDGARVSGEFAGNLDFNMLNLSNIDKIEIIEGGMSSLYGSSAIGGVINIKTNKRKNSLFNGTYSYLSESPIIEIFSLNQGVCYNNFNYTIDFVQKKTKGYDLTPPLLDEAMRINKTQEEYYSNSIKHTFGYNFKIANNMDVAINLKHKRYINTIHQYEKHQVHTTDENSPLYPFYYYETKANNSPMFKDYSYGASIELKNIQSSFKIDCNIEEYKKYSYFFNYEELPCYQYGNDCNDTNNLVERDFINSNNTNKSLVAQYNHAYKKHRLSFGLELNNDSYSSFNIYQYDHNNDNLCGIDTDGDGELEVQLDCWSQSIFNEEGSRDYKKVSLFAGDQIVFKNNNKINLSIRNTNSNNFKSEVVYAFSYIDKNLSNDYNFRFNYSKGFRTPSIKELYYNFLTHQPNIIGNTELEPTTNNYFSVSANTIKARNNLSLDIFYNKIYDMIGTKYLTNSAGSEILQFINYPSVTLKGFNCHYERILSSRDKVKFFYNYTNPESSNQRALDLISKHSMRFYFNKFISEKIQVASNIKYSSSKNAYIETGTEIKNFTLEEHVIIDLIGIFNISDFIKFKLGCKNMLNYKDKRRFLGEYNDVLATYDPGRRLFAEFIFNY